MSATSAARRSVRLLRLVQRAGPHPQQRLRHWIFTSPAKGNGLGLIQKSLLEAIWRMAESKPTIFAGAPAWILGCQYRTYSNLRPLARCPAHTSNQSDAVAGCLGFFFGPVGLWHKGHRAAGFAWLAIMVIVALATGGLGIVFAPIFWIGMIIHAIVAKPFA